MKKLLLSLTISLSLLASAFSGTPAKKDQHKKSPANVSGIMTNGQVNSSVLNNIISRANQFLNRSNAYFNSTTNSVSSASSANFSLNGSLPTLTGLAQGITKIETDPVSGTPRFIGFSRTAAAEKAGKPLSKAEAVSAAMNFMEQERSLLKISDPQHEFTVMNVQQDKLGMSHVRFQQVYEGIEVWGKDLYIHFDKNGNIVSLNGRYAPTPSSIGDAAGKLSSSDAVDAALTDLKTKTQITKLTPELDKLLRYSGPSAKKVIWCDNFSIPHLAWYVEAIPSLGQDWYYFIDANTGKVLDAYNNICGDGPATATATDLNGVTRTLGTYQSGGSYYMIDASLPMFNAAASQIPQNPDGAVVALDIRNQDLSSQAQVYFVTSSNNQWSDPAAVSANFNAVQTYDYYKNMFGRNSINDSGMTIYSIIHVTQDGQPMDNAFWSNTVMCYGDGNQYFKPLAGGLDVSAHEMTHGVTQHTAGLVYQDQSGALNESVSDVFGALVDSANWTMGEKIIKDYNAFPSGALRDLSNPHNGGNEGDPCWQPAVLSEYVQTSQDNGGVHINSGIPNHAFYYIASAIGRDKAGAIWYRALTKYFTRSAQFVDARIATEQAAADLYGASSQEVAAVKNGWDQVGVNEGSATPPPPTTQLTGQDWVLAVNTDPTDANSIYMVKPVIQSNSDLYPLSQTPVLTRPAVSDTSGIILFVDSNHDLRILDANSANPQEAVLDTSGIWESVAIGPGINSIALTTKYIDTTVYYLDLTNDVSIAYKIRTQSYDGPVVTTALYADAMSFSLNGEYLLFDAYNEIPNSAGGKISFWNIDLLDVKTGKMVNVFSNLSSSESVGNPSFAKTSATRFAFDYFSSTTNQDYVMTYDLQNGNIGTVAGPNPVIGYPTYSKDDNIIAYHNQEYYNSAYYDAIYQMPMQSDHLNGTGSSQSYLIGATYPVWFVIGGEITGIQTKEPAQPSSYAVYQNYPNPFNPSTVISYQLPAGGHVSLKVYDILGNEVATLVDKEESAGNHQVVFNALNDAKGRQLSSGIYFYRLQAGSYTTVRKMMLLK